MLSPSSGKCNKHLLSFCLSFQPLPCSSCPIEVAVINGAAKQKGHQSRDVLRLDVVGGVGGVMGVGGSWWQQQNSDNINININSSYSRSRSRIPRTRSEWQIRDEQTLCLSSAGCSWRMTPFPFAPCPLPPHPAPSSRHHTTRCTRIAAHQMPSTGNSIQAKQLKANVKWAASPIRWLWNALAADRKGQLKVEKAKNS